MREREPVTSANQVEKLMERPLLYNNIDGVGELALGTMFLGSALLEWLPIRSSIWHRYGSFLSFLLLITAIHFGVKAIKTHITYPRTGFVEYRRRDFFWRGMVAGAVLGLVFGVSFALAGRLHLQAALGHLRLTMPATIFGLVFAAGYAWRIPRVAPWKLAVAAVMAICSIANALVPARVVEAMMGNRSAVTAPPDWVFGELRLTLLFFGAIMLVSGGISLVLYLRHTQPPAQAAA